MRIYVTPRFLFHLYVVLIGIPIILALLFAVGVALGAFTVLVLQNGW